MAKPNKGFMYVSPDSKREGSYNAEVPTIWGDKPKEKRYFGVKMFTNPKLQAEQWVSEFLADYYGEVRANHIISIPHYINKMKFGCGVKVRKVKRMSKGKPLSRVGIFWSEYEIDGHKVTVNRRQLMRKYDASNVIEIEHMANLEAAQLRAELTFSSLHPSALNFEYDLTALKG